MTDSTEEKVLGPGAVLHKVDATGELIVEGDVAVGGIAEPADKQPVARDIRPTPTPIEPDAT